MDLRTLEQRLESVGRNYADEDKFYIYEERGSKLELIVTNSGHEYLKDVSVELIFPKTPGLVIAERIHLNSFQSAVATGVDH